MTGVYFDTVRFMREECICMQTKLAPIIYKSYLLEQVKEENMGDTWFAWNIPFRMILLSLLVFFKTTRGSAGSQQRITEKWHLFQLFVLYKTIVQQYNNEMLHDNGNPRK